MMLCSARYSLNMIVPFTTAKSPAAEAYGTAPNLANSKASVNALEYTIAASEARAGTSPSKPFPLETRSPLRTTRPSRSGERSSDGDAGAQRAPPKGHRGRGARKGRDEAARVPCPAPRAKSRSLERGRPGPDGRVLT